MQTTLEKDVYYELRNDRVATGNLSYFPDKGGGDGDATRRGTADFGLRARFTCSLAAESQKKAMSIATQTSTPLISSAHT